MNCNPAASQLADKSATSSGKSSEVLAVRWGLTQSVGAGAKDGKWLQVGAAWLNRDGSINAILNQAVEKGTRVQLRKRKAKAFLKAYCGPVHIA